MSASSPSSRRAQAVRQCTIVSGHESEPIQFSPLLFAAKSRRYMEEFVLGSRPSDIVIESILDQDKVVAFIAACQGADFSLTPSNVFEIEGLCNEWSVDRSESQEIHQTSVRPEPLALSVAFQA
jgi:hypothetical protein